MKRRSKMMIGVGVCALIVLIIVGRLADPIYRKLLLGWARVLTKEIPVTVEIDDHALGNVRCFAEPGEFRNHRSKGLVLWLENPRYALGYDVLVVDLDHGQVLVPNCGAGHYKLLRNGWLIQADSGAMGVPFGDSKLDANNPDFRQSGNVISFTIPPVLNLPSGRWNVTVDRKSDI
jgi:hypothetical protein